MKAEFRPKLLLEVESVNRRVAEDAAGYVSECERRYDEDVAAQCRDIIARDAAVVMVSGPSSSGKTTSAHKVAKKLTDMGRRAAVVSLDNFFKNYEDYPTRPDGQKDLESLYALDIDAVRGCLRSLISDGKAEIPQFDFKKQRPSGNTEPVDVSDGGILVMEGIHALNPALVEGVDVQRVLRLYAGLRMQYETEDDDIALKTRDIRIIRRIIRDFQFRGYSAESTLSEWENIMQGETRWIKAYKSEADLLLDTSFAYEPCVYRTAVERLFGADDGAGGKYRENFLRLREELGCFEPLPESAVPPDSMLREFIG